MSNKITDEQILQMIADKESKIEKNNTRINQLELKVFGLETEVRLLSNKVEALESKDKFSTIG